MHRRPKFADFFAGSGLVSLGAKSRFDVVWANDICPRKGDIYRRNHPQNPFVLGSIDEISGESLPPVEVAWGSFPCQDLSLAGSRGGLRAERSGLFWQWLRVLDEMSEKPRVVALENVVGLLSSAGGEDFREIYQALTSRGYEVGAIVLDASYWLPQSRPRLFVVGADRQLDGQAFQADGPGWAHPASIRKFARDLALTWWRLPEPGFQRQSLSAILDWSQAVHEPSKHERLMSLVSPRHGEMLGAICGPKLRAFPGYRRTRSGSQVLELRFDDCAGCLRTARGGSSKQFLILWDGRKFSSRLVVPREAARLMGAPDTYWLPESFTEAYNAMGDAVAVPVVEFLCDHLLAPLIHSAHVSHRPARRFRLQA